MTRSPIFWNFLAPGPIELEELREWGIFIALWCHHGVCTRQKQQHCVSNTTQRRPYCILIKARKGRIKKTQRFDGNLFGFEILRLGIFIKLIFIFYSQHKCIDDIKVSEYRRILVSTYYSETVRPRRGEVSKSYRPQNKAKVQNGHLLRALWTPCGESVDSLMDRLIPKHFI